MKVDRILIGKQVTPHLYHFKEDISSQELLKAIRYMAHKGRGLGYSCDSHRIFYTTSTEITRQEFDYVYENIDKHLDYLLDRYTREDLANKVGSAIRIISSTTKAEILDKILHNNEFLYRFFRQDFIEQHCGKWREFKHGKSMLPAISDCTKSLIFPVGSKSGSLSGKHFPQYWRLGGGFGNIDMKRDLKTEIIGDNLAINLKDCDEYILQSLHRFLKLNDKDGQHTLQCESRSINAESLDIQRPEVITYPLGLFDLVEYFGIRKGSKFKTFNHGLWQRRDTETAKEYLNKRFIIAVDDGSICCGTPFPKELFELLAWHLKIEYLKDHRILCRVVEDETPETITALWDMLRSKGYRGMFCFVEI
jgi:hypothetical protein